MYKKLNHQLGLADFNQPIGLKMNSKNRWAKKTETILWLVIEDRYAGLFLAVPECRQSHYGLPWDRSLFIKQYDYSDRKLVE